MADFWIDVELQDEEYEKKAWRAIEGIQRLHTWAVSELAAHYTTHKKLPSFKEFRHKANNYIAQERLFRYTQRYSLERAVEQTLPYVTNKIKRQGKRSVIEPKEIDEIQIRFRNAWRRYLARDRGLTTIFGTIFLSKDWKKILREQADEIPLDLFPFLWHSITLKYFKEEKKWKIKFNFHAEHSRYGEEARKQLEKIYGDI